MAFLRLPSDICCGVVSYTWRSEAPSFLEVTPSCKERVISVLKPYAHHVKLIMQEGSHVLERFARRCLLLVLPLFPVVALVM